VFSQKLNALLHHYLETRLQPSFDNRNQAFALFFDGLVNDFLDIIAVLDYASNLLVFVYIHIELHET
jgi:hypothetical protein